MRDEIISYLNHFDLDVRKSRDARFMDQKCTPDVVCFIADCLVNDISEGEEFTVNDIWESQYFIKNTKAIFNKPLPTNPKARNEYDKFIQQPLRMLAYARVLTIEKKGTANYYRINNVEILDYISQRERNTYVFLYEYFHKVLMDSGMWRHFEDYIAKGADLSQVDYSDIQTRFIRFIIGNTAINGDVEVRRIFPKILNVIAVENNVKGSIKGRISQYAYTFSDLMYNRKNWRDLNKDKAITRREAEEISLEEQEQQTAYNAYYVEKAKALIRKLHADSEVHDAWANGEATQVHHIFSQSQFPEIAHYIENLIKLTATQHYTKAHPNNRTKTVDRDYQLTCLLAKADTIDTYLQRFGDKYYRKESFVFVINTGLGVDLSVGLTLANINKTSEHKTK